MVDMLMFDLTSIVYYLMDIDNIDLDRLDLFDIVEYHCRLNRYLNVLDKFYHPNRNLHYIHNENMYYYMLKMPMYRID